MAFYKSKKILINSLLSLMSMILVGLAFQNCSNGLSSSSPASNTATSDTPGGMRVISDDNTGSSTTTGSTVLKIELLATDLLKVDCSIPGASYKFEVSNAGADITMCQEYTLDMPQGNSRYGESSKCDSSDKFVKPSSAWSYDSVQRKWSKTTQTSGDQYVPGDYRLYVRDSLGEARSSLLKIRHYGYANCVNPNPVIAEQPGTGSGTAPTSGGTTTTVSSCSWSGNDFSPAKPPTSTCNQNRANAKENGASGIEYTCVCTQTTVVVPPSSGGGGTTTTGSGNTSSGGAVTAPSSGAPGATCNPPGTKLVRFNTQLPEKAFGRTDYPMMKENEIYVFAFKTINTRDMATMQLTATQLSATQGSPNIFISECPGDISTTIPMGCRLHNVESSTATITLNMTPEFIRSRGVLPGSYCLLKPNTQYYASVFVSTKNSYIEYNSSEWLTKILPPSSGCTQPGWCGLSFMGR